MARYKYRDEWRVSFLYDCHFHITCRSLKDALWIAAMKDDNSLIGGTAFVDYKGVRRDATASIHLREARGKTIEEIIELFDAGIDEFIACRERVGMWAVRDVN